MKHQFDELGFIGPLRVLDPAECVRFLEAASNPREPAGLDWHKGLAASSRTFYDIATHPRILDAVRAVLGDDVMVWGASLLTRKPGHVHPWHSDIETAAVLPGRTATVWIGLDGTTAESALIVVPRSHRFGATVQEVRQHAGLAREAATTAEIVKWAADRDPWSVLAKPEMGDGEAIVFDGGLWHHSNNTSAKTRRALLLQYATPDTPIYMPDLQYLDWPFRRIESPRPPCVMVSGSDRSGVNRIVPAPAPASAPASVPNRVYRLPMPLQPDGAKAWTMYPLFKGATPGVRSWSCHASALTPGSCPHPPHQHKEEEILIVLGGHVELELPDAPPDQQRARLGAGEFVYYPAFFRHTLHAVSAAPANYLMFKWFHPAPAADVPLGFGRFTVNGAGTGEASGSYGVRRKLFAGPTGTLRKLHCHVSTLAPGDGYAAHADAYDVAIVTLEGEVETLGEHVGAHAVLFHPAGALHGLRNPGPGIARYVVFEFHGSPATLPDMEQPPDVSLLARLTDPQRWTRKVKHLLQWA